jgi:hypothetical protein
MKKIKISKGAVVLLIAVALILPTAVAANANNNIVNIKTTEVNSIKQYKTSINRNLVWDNVVGVHGGDGGIFVATERPDGVAEPADDFQLDTTQKVNKVFWQGGYFQCELAQGFKDYEWNWSIIFWDNHIDGWHPGNEIHNWTIINTSIQVEPWYTFTNTSTGRKYWIANYSTWLPETVTFEANTKYWITIRGVGAYPPQACWVRHNGSVGGIKLHEAVFRGALWTYTTWYNLSEIISTEKIPHDFNFQLLEENQQPKAPTIIGPLTGKAGEELSFIFNAVDPDGDQVKYIIDWDDTTSNITDLYPSGQDVTVSHTWGTKGTYTITAKAQDSNGLNGPETTKTITIKKSKALNLPYFKILQNYQNLLQILKNQLGL